jgi:hypothetical protein
LASVRPPSYGLATSGRTGAGALRGSGIALYFFITYVPFFVLGSSIAEHSLGGLTA